ncbi:hypothetical protein [Salinivirga cyanobacteriivorans]
MRSRIISAYVALCAGARNIIDKRIKTDTVLGFIRVLFLPARSDFPDSGGITYL